MAQKIYSSAAELTGSTPLLEIKKIERLPGVGARILLKLESFNPSGSVKDRAALAMIEAAEKSGELKPGGTIIEPTSGNTGVGLAAAAAAKGYKLIAAMPESMSRERRQLMAAYGAQLVLTPSAEGMKGAVVAAERLHKEIKGSIIAGQFVNAANPEAHYRGTGPEIYKDTEGVVDIFVAGVGTGGTITGVGRYLKEKKPSVKIVAVEPAESPVLSGGSAGPHKIQGIGAGFKPEILQMELLDQIMRISSEEAYEASRLLAREEGFLVGVSSGAALAAAIRLAKEPENTGKVIVALMPDSGERYLSTGLFEAS